MSRNEPSAEQQIIIDDPSNVVVTARPGSGKTFTIVRKIEIISTQLLNYQGVVAISYTRKASRELEMRCKHLNIKKMQSFYGTIDKFYISQIIIPFAKHLTRSNTNMEVKSLNDFPDYQRLIALREEFSDELVDLLIQSLREGIIFLELCGEIALYILKNAPDVIVYFKAKYTHIFIDEYQDCGKIQHEFFMFLVVNGIKGIAVGDIDQAIYGFTGRSSFYLNELLSHELFNPYQITKNHRCHKTISAYSLKMLGNDVEIPEEESRVFVVNVEGSDIEIMQQIDARLERIKTKYDIEYNSEIAILCRNNATATRAKEYLNTNSKLFTDTPFDSVGTQWARVFNDLITGYFNEETYSIDLAIQYIDEDLNESKFKQGSNIVHQIYSARENDLVTKIDLFIDFANLVYPEHHNQVVVDILEDVLSSIFDLEKFKPAMKSEVCILTLHKSKGLEFKAVFHLDLYKWIFPWERISWEEYLQSLNLHYVGVTRAIEVCYLMNGSQRFRLNNGDFIDTVVSPFLGIEGTSNFRIASRWE